MRSAVTIKERRDGKNVRLQAFIYALAPGALKAERHRLVVPVSITSRSGAQRWAEQVRRDIEAGKPLPQTRDGRQHVEARQQEKERAATQNLTLEEGVKRYLADCVGRGVAPSTLIAKQQKLAHIPKELLSVRLKDVGEVEASRIRSSMREDGYAVSTINEAMRVFATMLNRCQALKLRGPVTEPIERISERKLKVSKAYDDSTFEALVAEARAFSDEHLALVLLCGEAALRIGEVIGLEVGDVDLQRQLLKVDRAVAPTGEITVPKNGETRVVPLTERLATVLAVLTSGRQPSDALFPGKSHLGRLSRPCIRYRIGCVQQAVGLPVKGPHALRHTCATSALLGGADVLAVQKMLGHRALKTTVDMYLHDTGDAATRAVSALETARSATAATVTDLARAPKTSVYVSRSKRKKRE